MRLFQGPSRRFVFQVQEFIRAAPVHYIPAMPRTGPLRVRSDRALTLFMPAVTLAAIITVHVDTILRRSVSFFRVDTVLTRHWLLLSAVLFAFSGQSTSQAEDPDLPVRIWMRPPTPPPVPKEELDATLDKGVKYLIDTQRKDGAWGGPQWRGGVDNDPVPGSFRSFDIAIAAMALEALLDSKPSASVSEEDLEAARTKALDYLFLKTNGIQRAGPGDLPHIWAHGYSLQTFAKIHSRSEDAELKKKLEDSMRVHADRLKRWESVNGGWFYYGSGMSRPINPSCSFVNGAILVSLARAREVGIDADSAMLERAIKATQQMRKPDGSFLYTARIPGGHGGCRSRNQPTGRKPGAFSSGQHRPASLGR